MIRFLTLYSLESKTGYTRSAGNAFTQIGALEPKRMRPIIFPPNKNWGESYFRYFLLPFLIV